MRCEVPIRSRLIQIGEKVIASLDRLATEKLPEVVEYVDVTAIVGMAQKAAIDGGCVDRLDAGHEQQFAAGVARARAAIKILGGD